MTIQMLATWNGLEEESIYTLAPAEETRLIGLGLARAYTAGMDGVSDGSGTGQASVSGGARPLQIKTRVLIVGASNAFGWSASTAANSWAGILATKYAETHEFINVAIPGKSIGYWMDEAQNAGPISESNPSAFESAIIEHKPDVVIVSCTLHNVLNFADTSAAYADTIITFFMRRIQKALAICRKHDVKPVLVAPNIANNFLSSHRAANREICRQIKSMGWPVLDWQHVSEVADGSNIPAIVDSGDGTHFNDLGHALQAAAVPSIALQPGTQQMPARLLANVGMTIPNNKVTPSLIQGPALGAGSWSVGFFFIPPATNTGTIAMAFFNTAASHRLRAGGGTRLSIAAGSPDLVMAPVDIIYGSTTPVHVLCTYHGATRRMSMYYDGVYCGSTTVEAGISFNQPFNLGGHPSDPNFNTVGFQYFGCTLNLSELNAREAFLCAKGAYQNLSLSGVWPMDDCALVGGKAANEQIAMAYGIDQRMRTAIAI